LPPTWEVAFANRKKLTKMMKVSSRLLNGLVERKVIKSKHRKDIEVSAYFCCFHFAHSSASSSSSSSSWWSCNSYK